MRIMRGGADPNTTLPEGLEAAVDVRSLLEQPFNLNFITDHNCGEVGGTFVWHKIVTKPPTLKQLMVGKSAPQKQANGMKVFSEVVASTPVSDLTSPTVRNLKYQDCFLVILISLSC